MWSTTLRGGRFRRSHLNMEGVSVTRYTRTAAIDPNRGSTVTFQEIWIATHGLCVNNAHVSGSSLNIFKSEEPILSGAIFFGGLPVESTNVHKVKVSQKWVDMCARIYALEQEIKTTKAQILEDFQYLK